MKKNVGTIKETMLENKLPLVTFRDNILVWLKTFLPTHFGNKNGRENNFMAALNV